MQHSIKAFWKWLFTASLLLIAGPYTGNVLAAYTPGYIYTVAGTGGSYPSNYYWIGYGGATSYPIGQPQGVAFDGAGNLYIADTSRNIIRKVTPNGTISPVAGDTSGLTGYSGDNGPASLAKLFGPSSVAVDSSGNLYIADTNNGVIRKVATNGVITTVAGNGINSFSGNNGLAIMTRIGNPEGIAVDSVGNLYFASDNLILKVAINGTISLVAGNIASGGYSGDNGSATSAKLYGPQGVAVDGAGNLYIADSNNNRIRKVTASTGIITTVAGNGTNGYSGDNGPATSATLNYPNSVAVDSSGNLYIADTNNGVIRKVATNGVITTVAGNGINSFSGNNGPAILAALNKPSGIALDGAGNLYIADTNNNMVRMVVAGQTSTLTSQTIGVISFTPTTLTVGGSTTVSAAASSGLSVSFTSTTPSICAVSGSTVTGYFAGTCIIAANQVGNSSYSAATQVTQSIQVAQSIANQTIGAISFTPTTLTVGSTATVSATSSSSLAVSFSSTTPSACTVSGSAVTGVAAGTCTIVANQAGNASYSAAPQVIQSITVVAISRTDCLFNWAEKTYPQFFSPAGATDVTTVAPYTYRYYSGTGNYLAVSSANNSIYVMGFAFGGLLNVGPVANFLAVSGCP